jgi:hypothetical protein
MEAGKDRREKDAGPVRMNAQGKLSVDQTGVVGDGLSGPLFDLLDPPKGGVEDAAGLGEPEPGTAYKESCAKILLQLSYMTAHGLLGNKVLFRRSGKIHFLNYIKEHFLTGGHSFFTFFLYRSSSFYHKYLLVIISLYTCFTLLSSSFIVKPEQRTHRKKMPE